MLALESGEHVKSPHVDMLPVKAFRLEPQTEETPDRQQQESRSASTASPAKARKPSRVTVDGELVGPGPIQARVVPRAANFFVKK